MEESDGSSKERRYSPPVGPAFDEEDGDDFGPDDFLSIAELTENDVETHKNLLRRIAEKESSAPRKKMSQPRKFYQDDYIRFITNMKKFAMEALEYPHFWFDNDANTKKKLDKIVALAESWEKGQPLNSKYFPIVSCEASRVVVNEEEFSLMTIYAISYGYPAPVPPICHPSITDLKEIRVLELAHFPTADYDRTHNWDSGGDDYDNLSLPHLQHLAPVLWLLGDCPQDNWTDYTQYVMISDWICIPGDSYGCGNHFKHRYHKDFFLWQQVHLHRKMITEWCTNLVLSRSHGIPASK